MRIGTANMLTGLDDYVSLGRTSERILLDLCTPLEITRVLRVATKGTAPEQGAAD